MRCNIFYNNKCKVSPNPENSFTIDEMSKILLQAGAFVIIQGRSKKKAEVAIKKLKKVGDKIKEGTQDLLNACGVSGHVASS